MTIDDYTSQLTGEQLAPFVILLETVSRSQQVDAFPDGLTDALEDYLTLGQEEQTQYRIKLHSQAQLYTYASQVNTDGDYANAVLTIANKLAEDKVDQDTVIRTMQEFAQAKVQRAQLELELKQKALEDIKLEAKAMDELVPSEEIAIANKRLDEAGSAMKKLDAVSTSLVEKMEAAADIEPGSIMSKIGMEDA